MTVSLKYGKISLPPEVNENASESIGCRFTVIGKIERTWSQTTKKDLSITMKCMITRRDYHIPCMEWHHNSYTVKGKVYMLPVVDLKITKITIYLYY